MRVRAIAASLSMVAALAAAACGSGDDAAAGLPAEVTPAGRLQRAADILLASDSRVLQGLVPQQATLGSLLRTHSLLSEETIALVKALSTTLDPRRVRAGQPYKLDRYLDGRVREFEYEIDRTRRVVARRREAVPAVFDAEVVSIPTTLERAVVEGAISKATPSLVQALEAAGEDIELSLSLADVFSGELDFSSDLQPGDTFRVVVERATREDGVFVQYGPVLAAEYVNAGRRLQAVRFTPPDGKPGYYDATGRSLKRFFLKSPLKFEPRITSSFSQARRHPVLNYTRAHNGVDYAAPPGAPVGAVAGGLVTFAGWTNGGGRTVKVRHGDGYESEYLHLSSLAVASGTRVGQGELIGRVGSTGLATGPHLHYGLRRNGAYVNPVRAHQNMPPGEPIGELHRTLFEDERDGLFRFMTAPAQRRANN